jgi:hypothetical protein
MYIRPTILKKELPFFPSLAMAMLVIAWSLLILHAQPHNAISVVCGALVVLFLWIYALLRNAQVRQIFIGYISLMILLILQVSEHWILNQAETIVSLFPLFFAPPFIWSASMQVETIVVIFSALLLHSSVIIFAFHSIDKCDYSVGCSVFAIGGLSFLGVNSDINSLGEKQAVIIFILAMFLVVRVFFQRIFSMDANISEIN